MATAKLAPGGSRLAIATVSGESVLKVSGGGASSDFAAAFPATGSAAGFSDGTNMQGARVYDTDSGAGSELTLGAQLRVAASGGSVAITGDAANGLDVDVTRLPALPTGSNTIGSVVISDSTLATYGASATAIASAASATDIFEIGGSATKTVRVRRLQISGVATTTGTSDIQIVKRSTANSGGTSTGATAVPHDSASAAVTATVKAYTANPTLGNAVGTLMAAKITTPNVTATVTVVPLIVEFKNPVVLRGTAQQLAVNLNGVSVVGGSFNVDVTWTEE